MRAKFVTPEFDPSDPLVCHSLMLRPSLWTVFWYVLQELGHAHEWRQDDPTHATPEEVAEEITKALDSMIFAGCILIGQIIELSVEIPPDWMLLCDGDEYLRADYPELVAVIDPAFYTDGTHFRVPDRTLRFGVGGVIAGTQGGELEHTLTIAEMPEHRHPSHIHAVSSADPVAGVPLPSPDLADADWTGYEGNGEPHNNMPPYEGTAFYIIAKYPTAP